MKYLTGETACYIVDYDFEIVSEIPMEVAVAWVKHACPETNMGNNVKAKDLTINESNDTDADKNGWLNKLFVIVGCDLYRVIALYNHDGKFHLRVKNVF